MGLVLLDKVVLDGIDEDEFLAATAFVVKPAPFELAVVAEVVDCLFATGHERGGLGHADPGGGTLQAEADFPVDRRGEHFDEPRLLQGGGDGDFGALHGWLLRLIVGIGIETAEGDDSSCRGPGFASWVRFLVRCWRMVK